MVDVKDQGGEKDFRGRFTPAGTNAISPLRHPGERVHTRLSSIHPRAQQG